MFTIFWHYEQDKRKNWTESNHGAINRSKTFQGIAHAIATQWAGGLKGEDKE